MEGKKVKKEIAEKQGPLNSWETTPSKAKRTAFLWEKNHIGSKRNESGNINGNIGSILDH